MIEFDCRFLTQMDDENSFYHLHENDTFRYPNYAKKILSHWRISFILEKARIRHRS